MNKKIEITIDEEGDISIEAFGYTGGECRLATEPFENAAGVITDRKIKSDECLEKERIKVR
jgi:fructose-specific phosphotransferase system component IIB